MTQLQLTKIISGGQTGADQGGLLAGKELEGIETGGTAPNGFRTELGSSINLLRDYFGLRESDRIDYSSRTRDNVRDSDGTAVFGDANSVGTTLTVQTCIYTSKPYIINPDERELLNWAIEHEIKILNVAGNRESKNPGIQERVRATLVEAFH